MQLTAGLDSALLDWLETHVEWTPAQINQFGTRAYAARLSDALKIAARLPMTVTAQHLARNQSAWDNRFRGLRWPRDIDLLRQFNLVLAQHQSDARFTSRWFASCDEAAWGSPYWQTSLSTGLIGLRKLPGATDAAPESRVAAALARFAALAISRETSNLEIQTTFRSRSAALTVLYPRNDRHWQNIWNQAIDDLPSSLTGEATTIRSEWLAHLPFCETVDGQRPQGREHPNTYGSIGMRRDGLPDSETLPPDEIESELDLVAAHRAGAMEGPGRRECLENWARARPSSYSARLLVSWRGREGNGLDRMAMSRIAEEFPEHHRWNDWLCYGFIDAERRNVIRREERDRNRQSANNGDEEIGATLWGGRLSAVYPELTMQEEETDDDGSYDSAALKRLLEDVAFAGAERALPSVSFS